MVSIFLFLAALITAINAKRQFIANESPRLIVSAFKTPGTREKDKSKNEISCKVRNSGRGACADSFLMVREKIKPFKYNYYISKPSREIKSDDTNEYIINFDDYQLEQKKLKYVVLYKDFFGKQYLAGNVLTLNSNKHFEILAKSGKMLFPWWVGRFKYWYWRHQAIKNENTYAHMNNRVRAKKQFANSLKNWNTENHFKIKEKKPPNK